MSENQSVSTTNNAFSHGMKKDYGSNFIGEGFWTHARNAATNSADGQLGFVGNEPANFECITYPLQYLIGAVPTEKNEWVLFFTDNTNSEIGIFDESSCSYTKVVNSPCLGFNYQKLITGVARRTFNCSFNVYWDDGLNPSRVLDINNVPWVQIPTTVGGCTTYVITTTLDCEQLRLAPHLKIPCLQLSQSQGSGTLPNGSYQVAIAYAVNGIKVTDYLIASNVQATFNHNNIAGAVKLNISWSNDTVETHFTEMEVVVISMVSGQTVAKRLGIYSVRESTIYIDNIDATLPVVELKQIPLQTPPIEKSDAMFGLNDRLLRVGIYTKPDFNYQPQANKITVKWGLVEYPDDYYRKGGMNVSYLRDENYIFYIRWIYSTGERSASYDIPGRAFTPADGGWQVRNTAQVTGFGGLPTSDGGTTVASGIMGFCETTERYPDDKPAIWEDLCGQPIRLHKMPDQTISNILTHFTVGNKIRVLGVSFDNVVPPKDNTGVPIVGIVGYEILRGSREGNKTVLAKGLLNNMREYDVPGSGGSQKGVFQNYPYNDLRPDFYLTSDQSIVETGTADNNRASPLTVYKTDMFSFHSPDTNFRKPFLGGATNLKVYQEHTGTSIGRFKVPYQHPKFKVLTNFDSIVTDLVAAVMIANDVIAFFGGTPPNLKLTGTESIAFESDLLAPTNYPDGSVAGTATISTVYWGLATIANALLLVAFLPIKFKIIQQQILDIITGLIPARQFATQYNSHGFYNTPIPYYTTTVVPIQDYQYIKDHLQTFAGYSLNNLYRNDYVAIKLGGNLTNPTLEDQSRYTLSENGNVFDKEQAHNISAMYGGIKRDIPNQYGQVGATRQIPISGCVYPVNADTSNYPSPLLFGGDTYICRYTEKNPFLLFNDWLMGQPDDYHYDYRNHMNVPYPRYWIDNRKVYSDFLSWVSRYRHLDMRDSSTFYVQSGNFYLSCNGVRDFYVESEVNIGYRDWEDDIPKRFFDPYGFTDYDYMFRSDYIKAGNYYKYDYSLSAGYFYNQYISWGMCLDRDYDPTLAYTCFDYYPRRVMYSLPQTEELKRDNWRSFLLNNYKDFNDKITSIKEIGRTGALVLFRNDSPAMLPGSDSLKTAGGTDITLGDGGLFAQPLQSLANTDGSLHHAACQARLSVISTPYGIFWVSQDSGKIFQYSGQLEDITKNGLKWWMAQYLPSVLQRQFPQYETVDSPITGVGVQVSYDATNEVLYVSKKDYSAIDPANMTYNSYNGTFSYSDLVLMRSFKVSLDNPIYFQDASWTVSYDLKTKTFTSFHDWNPDYSLSAKRHILTSKGGKLWRHNERCDLYCNYYGNNYPFELEWAAVTGANVTTLRNIEYYLQAYTYGANCWDKGQLKNLNFDQAIISNDEQVSGLLRLTPTPVNNPYLALTYPIESSTSTEILYSLQEQKIRFNQFWDITRDRAANTKMWLTGPNGYTFTLNPAYVDYAKPVLQRKKFRHYVNRVFLKKTNCANNKIFVKFSKTNNQNSPR